MAVSINTISPEILASILRCLLRNPENERPLRSLVSSLCACRRWYEIGLQILWTDVVLNSTSVTKFTRECTSANASLVRSLTLKFIPAGNFEAALDLSDDSIEVEPTQTHWQPFSDFSRVLPCMQKLKTLSIITPPTHPDQALDLSDDLDLDLDVIRKLLRYLPESGEKFELDTLGNDVWNIVENHLCPLLNTALRHLKHVKVVGCAFCPTLFGTTATGLRLDCRSPTFENLQTLVLFPSHCLLTQCSSDSGVLPDATEDSHDDGDRLEARRHLVEAAQAVNTSTHMPKISRFAIFGLLRAMEGFTSFDGIAYDAIIERDLKGH
jgi:hypothetical protein